MKIAVIGTGQWGKNHVRSLKELMDEKKIDDLYLCDQDKKRVTAMGKTYGVSSFTDYNKLPRDLDGVVIATPSDTHKSISQHFLERGVHVLVEKPMALSSSDADEMIKTAQENNSILMVGHIFRYHSAVLKIKDGIARGDFGDIYYMMSNRFSLRYPRMDMGVLYALGIHEVDIFCDLLNTEYPMEILAVIENYVGKTEETAQIIMFFEEGIKGYSFENWLNPVHGKKRELIVVGSRLSALVDYLKPNEIRFYDSVISKESVTSEGSYLVPIEYKEPLKQEHYDFISCIKSGKQPVANMYVGQRSVEIIEKAFLSAKTGAKVSF